MNHNFPDFRLIVIGKKVKRISLQRFLLSKFLFEGRKIQEQDIVCLFENQIWLESRCLRDSRFYKKFGREVFSLSNLLKNQDAEEISEKSIIRVSKRLTLSCPEFLVPKRNYEQWKSRFAGSFHLNPILDKEIRDHYNPKVPPERRVGVGYRDKGSKRNLAKDGSPDWTEISLDENFQKEQREYDVDKCESIEEIGHLFYRLGLITEKTLRDFTLYEALSKGDSEAPLREKRTKEATDVEE